MQQTLPDDLRDELERRCVAAATSASAGRHAEAVLTYQQALSLFPQPVHQWPGAIRVFLGLADVLRGAGDVAAAHKVLDDALWCAGAENNPLLLLRLGQIRYALGDMPSAQDALSRAYSIEPMIFFPEEPVWQERAQAALWAANDRLRDSKYSRANPEAGLTEAPQGVANAAETTTSSPPAAAPPSASEPRAAELLASERRRSRSSEREDPQVAERAAPPRPLGKAMPAKPSPSSPAPPSEKPAGRTERGGRSSPKGAPGVDPAPSPAGAPERMPTPVAAEMSDDPPIRQPPTDPTERALQMVALVFGALFAGGGVFALATHNPGDNQIHLGAAGLVLGLGAIAWGLRSVRAQATSYRLVVRYPTAAWRWRAEWHEGAVLSAREHKTRVPLVQISWVLVALLAAFGAAAIVDAFRLDADSPSKHWRDKARFARALGYALPGAALALAGATFWLARRRARRGEIAVTLEHMPATVGSDVGGTVTVRGEPPKRARLLLCVQIPSADDASPPIATRVAEEPLTFRAVQDEHRARFALRAPQDAPPYAPKHAPNPVEWTLVLVSGEPTATTRLHFEIPVVCGRPSV